MRSPWQRPPPEASPTVPVHSDGTSVAAAAVIMLGLLLCIFHAVKPHTLSSPSQSLLLHSAGMLVNIIFVAIPGRFDSDIDDPQTMVFPWPTLLSPAGFAFAIWGVIYVGEVVGMAVLLSCGELADRAAPAARAWLSANVAQALWCLSFRPWALDKLWLSSACLIATAACLYTSQCFLTTSAPNKASSCSSSSSSGRRGMLWALIVYPRSLHTGWVAAASLVNLNAWTGMAAIGTAQTFAVAVLSLFGATVLAERYTAAGLCCAAGAIAWALFAISRGVPNGHDAIALGQPALDGLRLSAAAMALLCTLQLAAPVIAIRSR